MPRYKPMPSIADRGGVDAVLDEDAPLHNGFGARHFRLFKQLSERIDGKRLPKESVRILMNFGSVTSVRKYFKLVDEADTHG